MRVMVLGKATEDTERGALPTTEEFVAMEAFNEELVKAGVMVAAEGLKPSAASKRVAFDADGASTVLDGPFAETKELVAGYMIWEVSSLEEAIQWVRRGPVRNGVVEVRPIYGPDDFAEVVSPGLREAGGSA
jgi:hypothetical protein